MSSKVHSQGKVPFSWENKPGVSKSARQDIDHLTPSKLPLPPCPPESARASFHDMQIPLPPCAFHPPPSRSTSKKGLKKIDDPFLIAYKEVTKSSKRGKRLSGDKGDQGFGLKNMSIFSCKQYSSCVMEDSLVRLSQLPISKSHK
ncbi:hypothetical protein BUALT_Bualt08G0034300 [Buddleja alternifolia]|uniref:Uncharacterized protein n=1 Tax=Buddleja alternifolia TaxID=168488 RepID=A0AAV6X3R4_9LAMI|nr:hypothetical protein BUALT_Bualt08G0034300 [Buddleja alternifolia]